MKDTPLCMHAHECGGCSFQHIPYSTQLQQKQSAIDEIFQKSSVKALPIIPCSDPWHYRNKMEFTFSENKAGDHFLGLILRSSRGKVFNLQECTITSDWFSETLKKVKTWWDGSSLKAFHLHKAQGCLRTLILREGKRTGERMVMLTVSGDPQEALSQEQIESFVLAIDDPLVAIVLRLQICAKGVKTHFKEIPLQGAAYIHEALHVNQQKLLFKISPSSFFQPNTLQAEVLYKKALELSKVSKDDNVYDLYAGTSAIGMFFSFFVKCVTSIELNPDAVTDAQENIRLNKIENVSVLCGDVGDVLAKLEEKNPSLVIVDPPRSGLDTAAIAQLRAIGSDKLLYISCNPVTQERDIALLQEYDILCIQPVDQFPHTPHIENIVVLKKRGD